MSPRQNRRRPEQPLTGAGSRGIDRVEEWPDGQWQVRRVTGSSTGKVYRCPGCDQEVGASVPHVVAWPADGLGGAEDRRHWHTPCWSARTHRSARTLRGRGAPRYG